MLVTIAWKPHREPLVRAHKTPSGSKGSSNCRAGGGQSQCQQHTEDVLTHVPARLEIPRHDPDRRQSEGSRRWERPEDSGAYGKQCLPARCQPQPAVHTLPICLSPCICIALCWLINCLCLSLPQSTTRFFLHPLPPRLHHLPPHCNIPCCTVEQNRPSVFYFSK